MSQPPRKELALALGALLPPTWRIIDNERNLDPFDVVTVQLKLDSITRTPAAPIDSLDIAFTVTIASPRLDFAAAEDELDDAVLALIIAMDAAGIAWTECRKVLTSDRLGYDITLTITARKDY